MRRAGVMLAFGLTLALAFAITRPGALAVLPLPPPGQVRAEWLDDGTPVFVVHDLDGTARVLGSTHPFQRIDAAVVWCPPAKRFVGVFTATRYDMEGEWLGGPAPHGLPRWRAQRDGDRIVVGGPLPQAPRDSQSPDRTFSDEMCWSARSPGDVDPAVVVRHGTPFRAGVTAETLRVQHRTGTYLLRSVMLQRPGGSVQFCDTVHPGPPPRCQDPGLLLPSAGHGSGVWYSLEGWFRLRLARGAVLSGELLELTGYGPYHDSGKVLNDISSSGGGS